MKDYQCRGCFPFCQGPFRATFWRCDHKYSRLLHESPLLHLPCADPRHEAADLLHTWHLGGEAAIGGKCGIFLLQSRCLTPRISFLHPEEDNRFSLLALRADIFDHYKEERAADPTWDRRSSEVRFETQTQWRRPGRLAVPGWPVSWLSHISRPACAAAWGPTGASEGPAPIYMLGLPPGNCTAQTLTRGPSIVCILQLGGRGFKISDRLRGGSHFLAPTIKHKRG